MSSGALRRAGGVMVWFAFLIVTLGCLHRWGDGPLSIPPPPDWTWWIGQAGPAVAAAAIVRLGATAAGWYLLATTVLNVVLSGMRSRRLAQVVETVTPRLVRRLFQGVAGATIAASATASMAAADPAADDPPVMSRNHSYGSEPTEAVIMRRLPNEPDAGQDAETPSVAAGTTRTVQPGDHFWSIAESELVAARSRSVSDLEIDPFWRQLVAANLVEVPNPDLLFPGQVVHVPPVPPV